VSILYDYAEALRACLDTAYDTVLPEAKPAQICLRHGQQVIPSLGTTTDECCNGLAWVRLASVEPLMDVTDPNAMCTSSQRRVTYELGAVRCLPWGTKEAPPTCAQWTEVAMLTDGDREAMEAAICCARPILGGGYRPVLAGVYQPYGPDANCVGGTQLVTVEVDCGCV
jgi:hypothetical protein